MKKIVSMFAGLAAATAFAVEVPPVQVITFTAPTASTYADGSVVADGECYALCWSPDGIFEGINADGTAKDSSDKVVYIGKMTQSTVEFRIADGTFNGGAFDIWLLDSRVFENGAVKSVGKTGGSILVSYATKATDVAIAVKTSGTAGSSAASIPSAVEVAAPTVDLASVEQPKITNLSFDKDAAGKDLVVLEMETVAGVNYTSVGADTPTLEGGTESPKTTGTGGKITVIRPKTGDSAFFAGKVIGK